MGKILVLSIEKHEEHILNNILDVIAKESGVFPIAASPMSSVLSFPNLEIRINEQTVYHNDKLISLTHREFSVLTYLAKHPGWVFSAGQIYEAVWGQDSEKCGTAVASVIGQIRRKLTPETPKGGYILTVIGSGYKFGAVDQRQT